MLRTHCCGHIVAHDVSHVAQTGKHLLRTQNVSDQNQKHLGPGHKICVRNKCCACGQTGKHLCRQQCVLKNVSSFASTFSVSGYGLFLTWCHVDKISTLAFVFQVKKDPSVKLIWIILLYFIFLGC